MIYNYSCSDNIYNAVINYMYKTLLQNCLKINNA